jgi:hypothetical protein
LGVTAVQKYYLEKKVYCLLRMHAYFNLTKRNWGSLTPVAVSSSSNTSSRRQRRTKCGMQTNFNPHRRNKKDQCKEHDIVMVAEKELKREKNWQ